MSKIKSLINLRIFTGILILSLTLYNCKSSQKQSYNKKNEIEELDEDVFFGERNRPDAKPEKKEKKEKKEQKEQVKKVIKTARSFIGTPYRYGGATRSGMDCSGLLCTSFRSIDIILPRTSDQQSRYGKSVNISDLEEGDLVFFGERKGSKRVSHVGMVTEVNGKEDIKFIHSSTKLGVIETDLYSPYFIKIYIKAIRPF